MLHEKQLKVLNVFSLKNVKDNNDPKTHEGLLQRVRIWPSLKSPVVGLHKTGGMIMGGTTAIQEKELTINLD